MTTPEVVTAALLLGLATMPHCLAMCGPLAGLEGPAAGGGWRGAGGYLGGRLLGYTVAGTLLGALGAHAFGSLGGRWLGRAAIAALALACAWQALRALAPARSDRLLQLTPRRRTRALDALTELLPRRGFGLGLATTVFPCGALPAAWGLAAAGAHPARGAAAMLAFALASSPALVVAICGRRLLARVSARIPRSLQAAGWLAVALLLGARLWLAREGHCHG